jgi:peptidyl-prolyl cis-trans isomerase C
MILSVNGITLAVEGDASAELTAVRELFRQRAVDLGLLDPGTDDDATIRAAIETLLEKEVATPVATEAECRRYYEQNPGEFESGDLVYARHILFQVTAQVNVPEIRKRAEETLNTLLREPDHFETLARELSNCPSGQHGGNLGQIGRGDTVPEFEKALFQFGPPGIMRALVKTRYGFHIVAIDKRIPGNKIPFELVQEKIAERLRARVEERALRQYVSMLAGRAEVQGVDLAASVSPLVQ